LLELRSTSREAKDVLLEDRVPSVFVHILIRKLNLKDPQFNDEKFLEAGDAIRRFYWKKIRR
jgi:hypothetical protein